MNSTNSSVSASTAPSRLPTHEEISRHAQQLWEKYGRPEGRDEDIWLEAERELQRSSDAEPAATVAPAPTSAAATAAPTPAANEPASTRTAQRPSRATATPRMPGGSRNSRSLSR